MDYRDTINLPKTDFQMKAELPKREPEILKKWEEIGIYGFLLDKGKKAEKSYQEDEKDL